MSAAELLFDLDRLGVRLEAAGEQLRFHPRSALTPDLLARLKAHKADVLALLRSAPEVLPILPGAAHDAPAKPRKPVCRCGSSTWRDVPIHGGQSVRRDCRRCGRFLEFPVWQPANTLHSEQQ